MSWLKRELLTRLVRPASGRHASPQHTLRSRPSLDPLEDRTVPAVNDLFADALVIPGAASTATANTTDATGEAGEPNHAGSAGNLNSVWFKWTAPASGPVEINTFGSDFDTVLAVYTGTALSNLSEVASSDDAGGPQSQVKFNAVAGTTYYIAVDGFDASFFGSTGNAVLHLGMTPANDNFANAVAVGNGAHSGSNVGSTGEAGEPDHAGGGGERNSVWYKWTAPEDGMVDFNTVGSDFDTVMGVYTGDTVAGLSEVASNDDSGAAGGASAVSFQAKAGVTYYVAVDGYDIVTGDIVLNVNGPGLPPSDPQSPPPPPNAAPVMSNQSFSVAENSGAGAPVGTVAASDDPAQALTYSIIGGTGAGLFTIDPATGKVQVRAGAALNYEATNTYDLLIQVTDSGAPALSGTATVTVNLTDVNDAPVLNGGGPAPLTSTAKVNAASGVSTAGAGTRVADLIAGHVTDEDAGAVQGIAVVAADTAHGSWQFSTDGGATWVALGNVSDANARLLGADALIRFVPAAGYSGTVANGLTFRAWDQTSGASGGFADTLANGGSTAFSSSTRSESVTVLAPKQLVSQLLNTTESLTGASGLGGGVRNALEANLTNSLKKLDQGNVTAAVNNLEAFVNQVMALVKSGRLPKATGNALIAAADAIIDTLRA